MAFTQKEIWKDMKCKHSLFFFFGVGRGVCEDKIQAFSSIFPSGSWNEVKKNKPTKPSWTKPELQQQLTCLGKVEVEWNKKHSAALCTLVKVGCGCGVGADQRRKVNAAGQTQEWKYCPDKTRSDFGDPGLMSDTKPRWLREELKSKEV